MSWRSRYTYCLCLSSPVLGAMWNSNFTRPLRGEKEGAGGGGCKEGEKERS